jgi:tetratricopeptide (TPR) repeat protein
MAGVFVAQGRYAAALDAHQEALKTFRDTRESRWLVAILDGYAGTLVMLGRPQAAADALRQASDLVGGVGSARLKAQTLNTQGDNAFYSGAYRDARALFEQALQAGGSLSPDLELLARMNVGKTDVQDGRARAALPKLREIATRADGLRLRLIAAESRLYVGQALLATGDAAGARKELESALGLSEKLGLQSITANMHFELATAAGKLGDAAAAGRHLAAARQILDTLRQESRTDDLLGRADLRRIAAASRSLS